MAACGAQPVGFGGTGLTYTSTSGTTYKLGSMLGLTTYDPILRPSITRLGAARLAEARLLSANLKSDLIAASFMNK